MRFLNTILKILFNGVIILITLLLIIAIYCVMKINFSEEEYANFFGYTYFEVTTGSMSGAIEINDVIIVKITKDVHENDIISFKQDEAIITHRIIKEEEQEFITKGDANNDEDKPIQKDDVIGKVVKIIPKLGVWVKVFSEFKVIGSIFVTIILFRLGIYGNDDKKNKKTRKNRKNRHSFSRFLKNIKGIIKNEKK